MPFCYIIQRMRWITFLFFLVLWQRCGSATEETVVSEERGQKDFISFLQYGLTPPSYGHLPYILLNKTQGRSLNNPLFICVTSLMFCLAKHKGEGLQPFYRIIYRIVALRGVALVILGRCHKVTEGLKKIIWGQRHKRTISINYRQNCFSFSFTYKSR